MSDTITIPEIDEGQFARVDNLIPGTDFTINSARDLEDAGDRLKAIVAAKREIEAKRVESVKPLNDAVKRINDLFRAPLDRCKKAEATLKKAIAAYQARLERERREREEALRRKREEEQARLRKEAEAREAAERERARKAREKAEEEARQAEAAGRAERAEALRKQAEIEEQERVRRAEEEAEAKRQQAASMPAAVVEAPAASNVTGISSRKVWKFRVKDIHAIPEKYLKVDEVKIGKVVRALGDECDIPGIEVYEEAAVAVRA